MQNSAQRLLARRQSFSPLYRSQRRPRNAAAWQCHNQPQVPRWRLRRRALRAQQLRELVQRIHVQPGRLPGLQRRALPLHPSAATVPAQDAAKAAEPAREGRLLVGMEQLLGLAADLLPAIIWLLPASQLKVRAVQARRLGLQGHRGLAVPWLEDGAAASTVSAAAAASAQPAVPRRLPGLQGVQVLRVREPALLQA